MKKFSYCVVSQSEEGSIDCYTFGTEVHNGTLKDANKFLKYVRSKCSDEEWKIFMLVELPTKD